MKTATSSTPIASRLYAVAGAVAVTLAMLTGIDTLAGQGSPMQLAAAAARIQPSA